MATPEQLFLQFSAISDVGRIRKDNQDSGYAGPWLLTVCDGVGGAARGDLASATAVQALRKLDTRPSEDMLGQVAGAIHRANDRISEIIDEDPALNGTSTTASVLLFDEATSFLDGASEAALREALRSGCTIGEICGVLRDLWGTYDAQHA